MGCATEVEDSANAGGIQHLPALRFNLEFTRPAQLHQRPGLEVGAANVHRHPAVIIRAAAALIRCDGGDRQGQQVGTQHRRGIGLRLGGAHQDVVITRLGARDQQLLIRVQGAAVAGIKQGSGGHISPAEIEFAAAPIGGRIQADAQGFSRRHTHLVKLLSTRIQTQGQRRGQLQLRHANLQATGGHAQAIVRFSWCDVQPGLAVGDRTLKDFVIDIWPYDHAP